MTDHRRTILHAIVEIIGDRLAVHESTMQVSEDSGLLGRGIGIDSIEVMQLVLGIEAKFGVFVDDEDLSADNFRTFGDVVGLIERLQRDGKE